MSTPERQFNIENEELKNFPLVDFANELEGYKLGKVSVRDYVGAHPETYEMKRINQAIEKAKNDPALDEAEKEETVQQLKAEWDEEYEKMDLGALAYEALNKKYAHNIDKIGLSLNLRSRGGEGFLSSSDITIDIEDRQKLLKYFSSLQSDSISMEQVHALNFILKYLGLQTSMYYNLDSPDSHAIELLGSISEIERQTQRLDPDGSKGLFPSNLKGFSEAVKGRYLREYITLGRSGLMDTIGQGFGPSTWQTDSSEKYYEDKWSKALAVYRVVSLNPHANTLAEELKKHLLDSIAYAKKDIPKRDTLDEERKADFLNTLEIYKSLLE